MCSPPQDIHRRADFIFVPQRDWICSVLGWIGSAAFERSLRHVASQQGYHLSNHGLEKLHLNESRFIPVKREEDIFTGTCSVVITTHARIRSSRQSMIW